MKDLFQSLYLQLKDATGPTRTVIAAGVVLALLIIGGATYKSMNPDMKHLYGNLDERSFTKVSAALAEAGVRFETSHPPGPYTVWVAKPDFQLAMTSLHSAGALENAPAGIEVGTGGAASVFMGQAERMQVTQKRQWQEIQAQLEAFDWVAQARATGSPAGRSGFMKPSHGTVSVVLTVRGTMSPDMEQRTMAANIVRNGFGVPLENVVISDQRGHRIFDGSRDSGLEENLAYEDQFNRAKTDLAQVFLDETFGPGLARVSVAAEFSYEKVERLDENVSSVKSVLSEESRETSIPPDTTQTAGGAVTTGNPGTAPAPTGAAATEPATTSESRKQYSPGRNFTYTTHEQPVLKRMAVSLVLDESLADRLTSAQEAIKGVVGFLPDRDSMFAVTQALPGIERDEQGLPVPAAPLEPASEPMDPMILTLIEHGVEIVAALAFILLLLKGLRKGNVNIEIKQPANSVDQLSDDEIDVDALARRHVEDLLSKDPDRVGALLSRWALGDDYYMRPTE